MTSAHNAGAGDRPSLARVRGDLSQLPDADYRDFQDIKGIWEIRGLPDGRTGNRDG